MTFNVLNIFGSQINVPVSNQSRYLAEKTFGHPDNKFPVCSIIKEDVYRECQVRNITCSELRNLITE
jgi:hypothetical protein